MTGHWCSSEGRAQNRASFGTIVILLLSMATLTAAVGRVPNLSLLRALGKSGFYLSEQTIYARPSQAFG